MEPCAFGYSCTKCYPDNNYNEEEEVGINDFVCINCKAVYDYDERDEIIHYGNGDYICNDCFCYKCGNLKKLNVRHNGVECLPEEFFRINKKNFACKTCYLRLKESKERLKFLIFT